MEIANLKQMPVTAIKGVGAEREKLLQKLNVNSVYDLLYVFPREYENRGNQKTISELEDDETVTVHAMIGSRPVERRIRSNLSVCKFAIKDATGNASIVFYNQPFLKNTFRFGQWYYFYGKVSKNFGVTELQSPTYAKEAQGIVPIYPLTQGLSQNVLRKTIQTAFLQAGEVSDYLPAWILEEYGLCPLSEALYTIHFPTDEQQVAKARTRLVFDELFLLQLSLFQVRNRLKEEVQGFAFQKVPELQQFIEGLPFSLTEAQRQVLREIEADMESTKVMNRLVQGDVGSGKTIVALLAMLKAVRSGYQAAYMAPTEILAEQHFRNINGFLEGTGVRTAILKGSQSRVQREAVLTQIADGEADIIIGTHALIQESVAFSKLGLVITDEQHRFGVRQREILSEKSQGVPDVLVMTATPIPRTLGLILYGDLDISVIDTMPRGRLPIKTYVVGESMRARITKFILKQVEEGHQAYIVCPAIEEKEENAGMPELQQLKKAEEYYKEVTDSLNGAFRHVEVGLIHGKMKRAEQETTMARFAAGEIKILIATTVIEVGVDVPNATLMVVENAERFGLAQLHQLRGRVGRGKDQSFCVLFCQSNSDVSRERMQVMAGTTDGFVIAQKDLEIRGPGEFFGTRQHGLPVLKIANLYQDTQILRLAQKAAGQFLQGGFRLSGVEKNVINGLISDIVL